MQAECLALTPNKNFTVFKWDPAHLIFEQESSFYIIVFNLHYLHQAVYYHALHATAEENTQLKYWKLKP